MATDAEQNEEGIDVVLVDDHDLFRGGLRDILEDQGVKVVGEADNGESGVALVGELAPDVVVMDLNMPGMGGIEATREVAAHTPITRVLVLTISSDDDSILQAMMAGASGYMLKDASVEELVAGIRAAAAGESSISPRIASKLLGWLRDGQTESQPELAAVGLSDRKVE